MQSLRQVQSRPSAWKSTSNAHACIMSLKFADCLCRMFCQPMYKQWNFFIPRVTIAVTFGLRKAGRKESSSDRRWKGPSHLRRWDQIPSRESNPGLIGERPMCYQSATWAPNIHTLWFYKLLQENVGLTLQYRGKCNLQIFCGWMSRKSIFGFIIFFFFQKISFSLERNLGRVLLEPILIPEWTE